MASLSIPQLRLASQGLAPVSRTSPTDVVRWMGAIQAQDYPMARWAIGARLPTPSETLVQAAIDRGEIIRTHLLRPTWHFVCAEDIHWLLDLSAQQLKAAFAARDRQLELTGAIFSRCNRLLEDALGDGSQRSRTELASSLHQAGIATDQNRLSHILAHAEIEKIICSGADQHGKPTYALLASRVPQARSLSREEALATLASRYFASRFPATVADFKWWSGLNAPDTRLAVELIEDQFHSETIEGRTYIFPPDAQLSMRSRPTLHLLPPYDEFTLSYAERSASLSPELEQQLKQISNRGVFRPIVVVDGLVVGIWKRTLARGKVNLEFEFFQPLDARHAVLLDQAKQRFTDFLTPG